ncbi:MAG: hypothetical protein Ct9H300mP9_2460 [Candidatus Neomarinimicrobiota bacterium]|nr:MAG: hypothetical protein Ct9H300mP9_2460 [Candidatus Neomarinimicrobiota bacterium]
MVGYHSRAGSGGNPLAHTLSGSKIERMILNKREASEFLLHGTVAAKYAYRLRFFPGCRALRGGCKGQPQHSYPCHNVGCGRFNYQHESKRVPCSNQRKSNSILEPEYDFMHMGLPKRFEITIHYLKHAAAYRASHYPGAAVVNDKSVRFADRIMIISCVLYFSVFE